MLDIEGLKVSFGEREVLKGVDIHLERGDALSIIGESGAGKTTLAMSIMGLLNGGCSGRIVLQGRDILEMEESRRREIRGDVMAMVFQNVEDALDPVYTISDQIEEAILVHHPMDKDRLRLRVDHLLIQVGLSREKGDAYPHQLSGGERQRALIAMALANDPQVLILDEPTASLDAMTKAEILGLLRESMRDRIGLVVTHDISAASRISNRMAVLYSGRILEMGDTKEVLARPLHPYTRGLLRSSPNMITTKDLQGIPGRMNPGVKGCPFHPRCTQHLDRCTRETPMLRAVGGRMIACHRGGIVPLLEVRGLCRSFGPLKAVDGVDLNLCEGETLALVGQSGSGKTTLARMIMGLTRPDSGEIRLEGEPLGARSKEFYRRVQMIYQNPRESISHRMNVAEAIMEPLDIQGLGRSREKLERVLDEVELSSDPEFLNRYSHHLSGGEAQRVAIARALILDPKLLIADEPTSALDSSVQAKILRLLMDLQERRGLAILLVTHDLALARKVSDRMAVMKDGRILEEGLTSDLLASPKHQYTRELMESASAVNDDGVLVKARRPKEGESDCIEEQSFEVCRRPGTWQRMIRWMRSS